MSKTRSRCSRLHTFLTTITMSRALAFTILNKHFKLGFKEPVLERDFQWKGKEDLRVWDADHPYPRAVKRLSAS